MLAIRMNVLVRSHPSKYLFSDAMISSFIDPAELPFLCRNWRGDVWDVGASVGKYTPIMARNNAPYNVYAFEPNFNSVYYLAYRTQQFRNVVIVPNALTARANVVAGSLNPDFNSPSTGPLASALTINNAVRMFGSPAFVKLDIEGGEYELFESFDIRLLSRTTILVSWHRGVIDVPGWKNTLLDTNLTILEPL